MKQRAAIFVLVWLGLTGSAPADVPRAQFTAEPAAAGINHIFAGEWQYMVGGGVATFDCNGDLKPDLFLAGGEAPAQLYVNASQPGGVLKFHKQQSEAELTQVTGAYPLDIDSDGIVDLVILRVGENVIMKGEGNCRFSRANEIWGFDGGDGWSTAFAAIWELGEAFPTIAIGNYVNRFEEAMPWGSCTDNWLHRPKGNGGFAAPLSLKPSFCPLSMMFTDWDRSGTPALRVSNDREYYEGGQEQLWRIEPGKSPSLFSEKDGWKHLRIWGMGIASYDINFDSFPDYVMSSMADNKLQMLEDAAKTMTPPRPSYVDLAWKAGVTAHRPYTGDDLRPSTGWHTQIEDVNNDGLADIFIAKGNVAEMPDFAMRDPNNLLLQGLFGRFVEAGHVAGVASTRTARGASIADFNLDGLLDLVVVNRWENVEVWRNTTESAGHWLQLRLRQQGSNRDGIGAWIEVKANGRIMAREAVSGGGHVSGQLGFWHFGLGPAQEAELRITWPGREQGPWQRVRADNFYLVERGKEPVPAGVR